MTEPEPEDQIDDIPDEVDEGGIIAEPDEFADSKVEPEIIYLVTEDEDFVPDDGEETDYPDDYVP